MKQKKPKPNKGSAPGAPVTPVVSTDPATTDTTIASVMSPVPAVVSTDAQPMICAYANPPRSVAALADEEEEKEEEDPFPLRTYCRCKYEIHTDDDKAKGYEDEWRTCAHSGCTAAFHPECCATISFAHGLRNVSCDTQEMLCPKHHAELQTAHERQRIMLQHMTKARTEHLETQAAQWREASNDDTQALKGHKLRVCALITDIELGVLMNSVPVTEGGFAQRNVATEQASRVEQLMLEHGYNILAGNLALVEIPYTDDEVRDLKAQKLLDADFVKPRPLVEMEGAQTCKDGSLVFSFTDKILRMDERRFAIIDGNNRIIALIRICAESPNFLKNVCINAYLVDLNIHDSLAVQLASMRCNNLSHAHIADTFGDKLAQYVSVLTIFRKMFNQPLVEGRAARGQTKQVDVVNWIQGNAADLVDLLPTDAKTTTLTIDEKTGDQLVFKMAHIQAWVRLAIKASSCNGFVTWLQQIFAAHAIGKPQLTKGQLKVLSQQYIKMDAVWEHPDPIYYCQQRSKQIDHGLSLGQHTRQWHPDRRKLLNDFMGYGAEQMVCAAKVMEARTLLREQLLNHLTRLATEHADDKDVLALIPKPEAGTPNKLLDACQRMCDGYSDFDLFCILWNRSTAPSEKAARGTKKDRQFEMPDPATFNIAFFPRAVQDGYTEVNTKIQRLVEERRRAVAEAARNALIEQKKSEAIAAAQKKLEDEKAAAIVAVTANTALTAVTNGRTSRSGAGKTQVMKLLTFSLFFLFWLLLF